MRKLCTLTLVTVLFAGLYLAGCDTTTTTGPSLIAQVGESVSAAKGPKIDICHKRDDQGYILTSISVNAEAAHRAHGDGLAGDEVPGNPGFIFDEACVPVAPVLACPCWTPCDLDNLLIQYTSFTDTRDGSIRITTLTGDVPSTEDGQWAADWHVFILPATGAATCTLTGPGFDRQLGPLAPGDEITCRALLYERAAALGLDCIGSECEPRVP